MAAAQAGVADCEAHDGGLFAQDVNAWTSLALVAVGLVIVVLVVRRRLPVAFLGLAVAIVAGGVGSVLYHGDPGDTSQLVHDGSLVASAGFVAGWHVGRLRSGRAGVTAVVGLVSGLAAGVVGASTSAVVTDAFVAIAIVAIAISEVVARRRRLTPVINGTVLGLAGLGIVAWLLGRPDSPLCDPGSWAQPHGLWQLLAGASSLLASASRGVRGVAAVDPQARQGLATADAGVHHRARRWPVEHRHRRRLPHPHPARCSRLPQRRTAPPRRHRRRLRRRERGVRRQRADHAARWTAHRSHQRGDPHRRPEPVDRPHRQPVVLHRLDDLRRRRHHVHRSADHRARTRPLHRRRRRRRRGRGARRRAARPALRHLRRCSPRWA